MNPVYVVIELQTNPNGVVGTLITTFTDRNAAESKYHDVLRSAAVSALPKHAAVMMTEEGFTLKNECYTHEVMEA